ncbi:MAG: PRC-barrel domain-containing protein [Sporichthyaceae bacterium]
MRFGQAGKHDVVDVSEAATVARVEALVVDTGPARVVALRLGKAGDADVVAWSDLKAFGPDAVTVPSANVLRTASGDERLLCHEDRDLLGKRALTQTGNSLGTVLEVEFDPDTGEVTTVRTDAGELAGERLTGLGTYAAIFRD